METRNLAKELRIGNLVLDSTGNIHKIERLDEKWDFSDRKPIPLTEEWLLRFGFGQMRNKFYKKHVTLTKSEGFYVAFVQDELKSVHQLQNLYFALTGEELEINLTTQ